MRIAISSLVLFFALGLAAGQPTPAPPRVVSLSPANGAKDIDPSVDEIRICFSEPMRDRSWSVVRSGGTFPHIDSIAYLEDGTVLVMKVRLRPGTTYRFGLNSPRHRNFRSRRGVSLEPVDVTFTTSGDPDEGEGAPPPPRRGPVAFELEDVHGVTIRSQDYAGVPLFLLFGAAW